MKNTNTGLMTTGPIWKRMLAFAFPLFIGNLFQQLYNAVDSLIVGNFSANSKEALAAVSSSGNLIFLMTGFFSGIAMGAGVVIARYYGAGDRDRVDRAIHTNVAFGIAAGIFLTIAGVFLTPLILRWIGTPDNVLPASISYFRTYFFGVLFTILYNNSVGILQAMGDSKHPLYYLILSSLTNVVLDLLFVAVFHWGVWSAAFATVISQALSAVLCIWRLMKKCEIPLVWRKVRFDVPLFREILRMGIPSGMQNSIIAFANTIVQSNINVFGDSAMAGCGAHAKIEGFAFLPVTCFTMALTTFISQNLGAREYERAKKSAVFGVVCCLAMAESIGVLIWLFAPKLISLFNGDPSVIAYGAGFGRTVALFYFLMAFSHCGAAILRGAGRSTVPMLITLACWCLIRITYITITVQFIPRIEVVFWAYPITWTLSSLCFVVYLWKADWVHGYEKAVLKSAK